MQFKDRTGITAKPGYIASLICSAVISPPAIVQAAVAPPASTQSEQALAAAQQQQAMQVPTGQSQETPHVGGTTSTAPNSPRSFAGISENLSLWGYGEIYYTHPIHEDGATQFDLARAVFGASAITLTIAPCSIPNSRLNTRSPPPTCSATLSRP